ncbi:MAG: hypothetical protein C0621_01305 [Desulfuromonas sp.]|nr:MAG: hypothetical protein C0621_01305 [Desulfuromonas sp.]
MKFFPLYLLFLLVAVPALGATTPLAFDDGSVELEADHLECDSQGDLCRATGNVQVRREGMTLFADTLWWHRTSAEAGADGTVRLEQSQGTLWGEDLRLNLQDTTGRFHHGRVYLKERNFHLAGEVIERLGDDRYRVQDGVFTTCEGETPAWKFAASEVEMTVGGYAKARNVVFYLRDLPLLYLPYFIYPVKSERQSGLLTPRIGYSQRRGAELTIPYYQVLGRNRDATLTLDYFSLRGVGTGLNYRYLVGERQRGELSLYQLIPIDDQGSRSAIVWDHAGLLNDDLWLNAEMESFSHRDYLAEFGESATEYTREISRSALLLGGGNGRLRGSLGSESVRDLAGIDHRVPQRLPEVAVTQLRRSLYGPLGADAGLVATHFESRDGEAGNRLLVQPGLSLLLPSAWLTLESRLGYCHQSTMTEKGSLRQGVWESHSRLSTRLQRLFALDNEERLRHRVEVDLGHSWRRSGNRPNFYRFDAEDRWSQRSLADLTLVNRLFLDQLQEDGGRSEREVATLRLYGGYDLIEERRTLTSNSDRHRPLTPLEVELQLSPTRQANLALRGSYTPYDHAWKSGGVALDVKGRDESRLELGYRGERGDFSYLYTQAETSLFSPLFFRYEHRYNVRDERSLEQVLEGEYRGSCWSLFLTVRDRLAEKEYLLNFALSGLDRTERAGGSTVGRDG